MKFPENFLWGGAVTAHQSEGAYNIDGKLPSVCDLLARDDASNFHDGVDSYHRYDEDFALFEEMGFKSYRFSIDWSRVMPDGFRFNEEGMAFYDRYIDSMIAHGMEPICSLYHFEMPMVLYEKYNGFYSRIVVDQFIKYAYKMIDRYGDRVKKWISFNEHNGIILDGHKLAYGAICPDGVKEELFFHQLMHNSLYAHARVTEKVHTIENGLMLGMVLYIPHYGASCHPMDELAARNHMAKTNVFLDAFVHGEYSPYFLNKMQHDQTMPVMEDNDLKIMKENTVDWISLSYYNSDIVQHDSQYSYHILNNPYLEVSQWNWSVDPVGLRIALRDIYEKYRLPVMVVENGLGVEDIFENGTVIDDKRIAYLDAHIRQVGKAIEEGVDCRGYLVWGPIDILSSQADMNKRYGMIYVNRDNDNLKDMNRYKKKSFEWYKNVIQSNGGTIDDE